MVRRLWGVVMVGALGEWSGPLGSAWDTDAARRAARHAALVPGEVWPAGLWFRTRAAARRWCVAAHAKYRAYPAGHVCRSWYFVPVRVVERVEVVTAPGTASRKGRSDA